MVKKSGWLLVGLVWRKLSLNPVVAFLTVIPFLNQTNTVIWVCETVLPQCLWHMIKSGVHVRQVLRSAVLVIHTESVDPRRCGKFLIISISHEYAAGNLGPPTEGQAFVLHDQSAIRRSHSKYFVREGRLSHDPPMKCPGETPPNSQVTFQHK